jgi:hypothetical protein
MKTQDSSPARAEAAATAPARLPVEEQDSVWKPKLRAASRAIATTRSLKECVGFPESSFTYRARSPSSAARLSALTSLVQPGWRLGLDSTSPGTGSSARYRQMFAGPDSICSRVTAPRTAAPSCGGILRDSLESWEPLASHE